MPPPSGSTIYEPTGYTPGAPVKLLLCCHSAGRTSTDPFGTEGNACIASAQAAGYLCAASDAQNTAWGNPASCTDYLALIAYCEATYNVTGIMLWGSSMGGLNALTLSGYLRGPKVRGALLVQAVCDLNATYVDHPAFDSTIDPAYGMSGYSAIAVGAYDPYDRPASEYAGLRYRFYASPADTFVSKSLNSDAMAAKIASVALEAAVVAVTGDHGDPSHWNWAAFAPFIARVFNPSLTPATETDAAQQLTVSLRTSGLTLDPGAYWQQSGTALTVQAAVGQRREATGVVTSSTGGQCSFRGADAADFEVSLNGTDWASSVTVPAGDTPVWLSVLTSTPGAIAAEFGVPA